MASFCVIENLFLMKRAKCIKIKFVGKSIDFLKKIIQKVIHIFRTGNALKSSYARSYPRYPQKSNEILDKIKGTKQTNVL